MLLGALPPVRGNRAATYRRFSAGPTPGARLPAPSLYVALPSPETKPFFLQWQKNADEHFSAKKRLLPLLQKDTPQIIPEQILPPGSYRPPHRSAVRESGRCGPPPRWSRNNRLPACAYRYRPRPKRGTPLRRTASSDDRDASARYPSSRSPRSHRIPVHRAANPLTASCFRDRESR